MVAKSRLWCLVIEKYDNVNDKEVKDIDLLHYLRNNECIEYFACILHDKDYGDDGELKRPHYHVVLKFDNARSGKTLCKDIASRLLINDFCISYTVCRNFVKSVQYLIHQNDRDKEQYDLWDIFTSDFNDTQNILLNNVSMNEINIDYLVDLVNRCSTLSQVYRSLGLSKARMYRPIVSDIWKEKKLKL